MDAKKHMDAIEKAASDLRRAASAAYEDGLVPQFDTVLVESVDTGRGLEVVYLRGLLVTRNYFR